MAIHLAALITVSISQYRPSRQDKYITVQQFFKAKTNYIYASQPQRTPSKAQPTRSLSCAQRRPFCLAAYTSTSNMKDESTTLCSSGVGAVQCHRGPADSSSQVREPRSSRSRCRIRQRHHRGRQCCHRRHHHRRQRAHHHRYH